MDALRSRIYFVLIATAENANPNGDPLNGNRPRQHYDNTGYISAECIKRKMRNHPPADCLCPPKRQSCHC